MQKYLLIGFQVIILLDFPQVIKSSSFWAVTEASKYKGIKLLLSSSYFSNVTNELSVIDCL